MTDPRDEARALAAAHPRKWVVCSVYGCLPFRAPGGEIYVAARVAARELARSLEETLGQAVCAMRVSTWACKRVYNIDAEERRVERRRRGSGQSAQLDLF